MKKVFVGLSGGVDSAVSASLLKKEGYEVEGVFLKGWEPDFLPCTGPEDRIEAMRVAAHLSLPFHTSDVSDAYKREVVDYLVSEYRAGRTPNPDVMCNRMIKFGIFWERAKKEGAEYIATGHYARIERGEGGYQLHKGADEKKDQSYFLWTLTQDDLSHTLFPLGSLTKDKVRSIARSIKLPNAERKDSQGICFLGKVSMNEFLSHFIENREGVVRDEEGREVGIHRGIHHYTIGQRFPATGSSKKLFVIEKHIEKNELLVSEATRASPSMKREVLLEKAHWIERAPEENKKYTALVRSHGEPHPVLVIGETVFFDEFISVAPGQSVVIYEDTRCLGGGIVSR